MWTRELVVQLVALLLECQASQKKLAALCSIVNFMLYTDINITRKCCSFIAMNIYFRCRTVLEEAKELHKSRKRPNGVSIEDLATIKTKQKEMSIEVVYVRLYMCAVIFICLVLGHREKQASFLCVVQCFDNVGTVTWMPVDIILLKSAQELGSLRLQHSSSRDDSKLFVHVARADQAEDYNHALWASLNPPSNSRWPRGHQHDTWLRTISNDPKPVSLGLHSAYCHVQDHHSWWKIVKTAMLTYIGCTMMMMMMMMMMLGEKCGLNVYLANSVWWNSGDPQVESCRWLLRRLRSLWHQVHCCFVCTCLYWLHWSMWLMHDILLTFTLWFFLQKDPLKLKTGGFVDIKLLKRE